VVSNWPTINVKVKVKRSEYRITESNEESLDGEDTMRKEVHDGAAKA